MDPPRPEARAAIAQCVRAGIAVKMITGDHKITATAIARELGLSGKAITGAELEYLDSSALSAVIDDITVFARVAPEHKVRIVRALQSKGHVVAMTGDGVNDAPALKAADIGVAMGVTGTEVAKEVATMVLTDDNFATIVGAVCQGRTLYDNILKFVRFQLSTTIGAILTVFLAPLAGLPEPFSPLQILWINMIMDGPPAISLALDSARPGIMREPPRRRTEPVLPLSRLTKIFACGLTMMAGTLAMQHYGMQSGSEQRALTLAFTTFVLFQFFNVFNARNEVGSAFNQHFFDNATLWVSLGGRRCPASGCRALAAGAEHIRYWRHELRRLGHRDGGGGFDSGTGRRSQAGHAPAFRLAYRSAPIAASLIGRKLTSVWPKPLSLSVPRNRVARLERISLFAHNLRHQILSSWRSNIIASQVADAVWTDCHSEQYRQPYTSTGFLCI
ncbi:cation-translocating P-type ATPase [Paraburkholderia hospita]|uniref:cation-translocating P-type ATPase n=1 Tax=Paraburkholderia hospita TaxID=169430 RepID=UPI001F620267|nr:HAD-IC family P-type ATPase [Paraburkholderia hospita]